MDRLKSLKLRLKLRRTKKELRELHNAHLEAYKIDQNAIRAGNRSEQTEERSQQTAEISVAKVREVEGLKAQIDEIRSARLVRKLVKHGLDLPQTEWYGTVQADMPWGSRAVSSLTRYGESKVRRALKIDRREAWEFRFKVIAPILSGLTGLVGAMIGLLGSSQVLAAFNQLKLWLSH